jgi:hypothetical protein
MLQSIWKDTFSKHFLRIYLRGELREGAVIFNNLVGISLYQYKFFGLRVLIMFSISEEIFGFI